ncbi:MAG TPA: ribulose-phosphate 3-epimerase [Solirubrobacteraceae bacterium]|nr:ribulose-phosphate 3-epimerase [Solirubrobacteraceae bacterium]
MGTVETGGAGLVLRGVRVAPSILSADFGRLREQVREVLDAGARVIHVDVMDGHFVPPITLGPVVVGALREEVEQVGGMLDVHLMIERPERQLAEFVRAGAHSVTFHAEATPHAQYAASLLREQGACVGVAINPGTPVQALAELADSIDLALCMTVSPGWGGQPFIGRSPTKVARLRALLDGATDQAGGRRGEAGDGRGEAGDGAADARRGAAALEVDGGIDPRTGPLCRRAGADVFVAGSAIFAEPDPAAAYRAIADAVGAG